MIELFLDPMDDNFIIILREKSFAIVEQSKILDSFNITFRPLSTHIDVSVFNKVSDFEDFNHMERYIKDVYPELVV